MPARDASVTFDSLNREIWIVTSQANDRRNGLVATFVLGPSIVPELPRACVALAQYHFTRKLIEESRAFALHLIGAQHLEWVWRFGLTSGHDVDKFAGLTPKTAMTGSPILTGALAWMDCRVETQCDTGDRTLYVAEVVEASPPPTESPMTFGQMLKLASPDRLRLLDELLQRGRDIDAAAILAWRQSHTTARAESPGAG
jgi:flavin reductase (DIM6/NTAB) family NADH-FMN oxidoreductase RutF